MLTFVQIHSLVTELQSQAGDQFSNAENSTPFCYLPKRIAAVHIGVRMGSLPYDNPGFLEPAHDHDPVDISYLTGLPPSSSSYLPDEVQDLLPAVQEATSIAFASLNRLDDLLSQRLERLTILTEGNKKSGPGNTQCRWSFLHRVLFISAVHLFTMLKDSTHRFRTSLFLVSKPGKE